MAAISGEGLSALHRTSCNPVVAWGLFNFSHVSLALERGSLHLCCVASRSPPRPPPQLQRTSGSRSLGLHHEKYSTWEPCSRTWLGTGPPRPVGASWTPTFRVSPDLGAPLEASYGAVVLQGYLFVLWFWVSIFYFCNSFVQISLTYHANHPFKVCDSVASSTFKIVQPPPLSSSKMFSAPLKTP